MIIVSQDENAMISFNNICSITIVGMWDNNPEKIIYAINGNDIRFYLGMYKNEKTAKEILRKLLNCYQKKDTIYYMPKE